MCLRHGGGVKPFICWALSEFKFSNFAFLPNKSYFLFVVLTLFQHLTNLEDLLDFNSSPRERRGKCGLEVLRPTTPPAEKGGKWGMEYLRPITPLVVKRGVPLSKGEGRVRVQHGWYKTLHAKLVVSKQAWKGGIKYAKH